METRDGGWGLNTAQPITGAWLAGDWVNASVQLSASHSASCQWASMTKSLCVDTSPWHSHHSRFWHFGKCAHLSLFRELNRKIKSTYVCMVNMKLSQMWVTSSNRCLQCSHPVFIYTENTTLLWVDCEHWMLYSESLWQNSLLRKSNKTVKLTKV